MSTQPSGPANNPTLKQHTVTKCLLDRFVDPTTGKLKAFYLTRPREYDNPSTRVGYVPSFIEHEPQAHEDYWGTEVENYLPAAFASVDDETILGKPDQVKVLKDCIALHWARSKAYKESHYKLLEEITEQQKREWMSRHRQLLVNAFYDRYRLYPVGDQALEHINELLHEMPEIVTSGEWFGRRVRENFEYARNHFANAKLEVARPPAGKQFLIGDSPALPVGNRDGQVFSRVPLHEAGTVLLPIGPNHSIGLGKGEDRWIDLDESHVELLNTMQVCEALSWVMYHPSAGLGSFVTSVHEARTRNEPTNGAAGEAA